MKKDYGVISVFALILVILAWFFPNRYVLSVAVFIGINAIMVIGLNLLIGYAGQISLGHAAFFGIGSYVVGILTTKFQMAPLLAMGAAIVTAGLVAWIIGKPTLKLKGHYLAMATLGFGMIVQIVISRLDSITGGEQGLTGIPKLALGGWVVRNDWAMYFVVWGCVVVIQLMLANLVRGKVGRAFLAIHTNEIAAESLGIHTAYLKLAVFIISAVLAGLAGSLYAFAINYLSPEPFGFSFSILLLTMVIVGGMGDLWGPILGAVILGVLPEVLRVLKDADIVIYGLLLMVIVIFMPRGLISIGRRSDNSRPGRLRNEER